MDISFEITKRLGLTQVIYFSVRTSTKVSKKSINPFILMTLHIDFRRIYINVTKSINNTLDSTYVKCDKKNPYKNFPESCDVESTSRPKCYDIITSS